MKRNSERKLTGMILAALLCTGGSLVNISPVHAGADVVVNEVNSPVDSVFNGTTCDGYPSATGNQTGNTATIDNGTINNNVYGGFSTDGDTSNNVVTIKGNTTFTGGSSAVYGGMTMDGAANNNIVNILSAVTIPGGLYGGLGNSSSGNTLNIAALGVSVGNGMSGIEGFQNFNFFLPANITTNDTMLTVNGTANVTDAKIGVMAQGTLSKLSTNDKVTLLSANTLEGGNTITQTTDIAVPTGITTVKNYTFDVKAEGQKIVATLTDGSSGSVNEDAKSLVETRAATTTFINAGSDILASQGFAQAANAVAMDMAKQQKAGGGVPTVSSFTPFAAFGASSMRAESGSHVDNKGFGLNIGFAREIANDQGKLLFGPLVEYGGGKYDSYLDNGIHGDGKSHYWGIGIMARQINNDGSYYEGSLRGGRVDADYKGWFNNQNVTYDNSSTYIAAHLGLGKIVDIDNNNTLDSYIKYFFSHQGDDDVTMHGSISGDEKWRFGSVNSHRLRLGGRLTHKINDNNNIYGGLAYQYEFDGDATATYNGGSAPSPSVRGGSGMMELGWQVKPGGPVTVDLGITGWVGKQRGCSVQLGAVWNI